MIINKKILKNKELLKRFPTCTMYKIKRDELLEMRSYIKRISFEEIGYTYDDFLKDGFCKYFKEKKFLYVFYKKGNASLYEFCKKIIYNKIYYSLFFIEEYHLNVNI